MKKNVSKHRIIGLILLFTFIFSSVLFTACDKKRGEEPDQKDPVTETDTELLLSFDSYKEITSAGLKIGNQFGETKINKDKDYITEGEGSWLIKPQGNYTKSGQYPYFRLRCTESSFAKSDFNAYDKMLLDVFNDSDKEIKIELCLSVTNAFETYDSGEKVTCTLKPNAWTTCEYALDGEEYSAALDLTEVRYLNVTLLTKKADKDDSVPSLYLDNLRGHLAKEERQRGEFTCNFNEIVTFENVLDRYLFTADTVGANKLTLTRTAYADSEIGAQGAEFGEYGLQGSVEGATWPGFTIHYNEEQPAGKIVSFMVYVAADEAMYGDSAFYIEANGTTMYTGKFKFNRWMAVEFELTKDTENTWCFLNFDDGTGSSMFKDVPVTFYMDNFQMFDKQSFDFTKGVTFENPLERFLFTGHTLVKYEETDLGRQDDSFGTYGLSRDVTSMLWPAFNIDFCKEYDKGDILTFMLYVEADESLAAGKNYYVGAYGHDVSNDKKEFNRWVQVQVPLKEAADKIGMFLNFDDGTEHPMLGTASVTAYMDNFRIVTKEEQERRQEEIRKKNDFTKGITFEDREAESEYLFTNHDLVKYEETTIGKQEASLGTYGLRRDVTNTLWPAFNIDLCKEYSEGDMLTFMLYVEADESLAAGKNYYVGAYGHDVSNDKKEFNRWVQVQVPLKEAADTIGMFLNFDDGTEHPMLGTASVTAYMDNFRIVTKEEQERRQEEIRKKNDFTKGITFEDREAESESLFTNHDLVKYEETTLGKQKESMGTYGLRRDVTNTLWPAFNIDFCKEYDEGDILTFMLYVEADESLAAGKNYYVGAYGHDVSNDKKEFNRWVQVQVPLKEAADTIGMFLNFDDGTEHPMLGTASVTAYMDNFRIVTKEEQERRQEEIRKKNDFTKGITFEDREAESESLFTNHDLVKYEETTLGKQKESMGTYGLRRDVTNTLWPAFNIDFCKEYDEGDILTFMLYVEADESQAAEKRYFVGAYGHDVSNDRKEFNRWVQVQIPLKKAVDTIGIFLNFDDGTEHPMFGTLPVTAYMDNFRIVKPSKVKENNDFTKGITFEDTEAAAEYLFANAELAKYDETSIGAQQDAYGKYGIMRNVTGSTWPHVDITYDKAYAAGSCLTFKMYVEVDPDVARDKWCWVDSWYATSTTGKITEFNKWIDVSIRLTDQSTDKLDFFLNFDDGSGNTMFGNTPMKVYFDNFYIAEGNFEKGITLENPAERSLFSKNNVDYTFEEFDGTTALKYDSTGVRWPYIRADLNKTYTGAATRLCFRIYVKADESLVKDRVFYVGDDDGTRHPFNQWTEGWVKVANGSTDKQIYLNFDAVINAIGASTPITVYLDDFYLTTGNVEEGLAFENPAEKYVFWKGNADYSFEEFDGTTAMKMVVGQNWPNIYMALPQAYTEAKTLYFKVYAKADESTAADQVFYVGDNDPTKHKFNCWEEAFVTIPANQGYVNPFLNFEAALKTIGSGNITLYLDDFQIR